MRKEGRVRGTTILNRVVSQVPLRRWRSSKRPERGEEQAIRISKGTAFQEDVPASAKALRQDGGTARRPVCWNTVTRKRKKRRLKKCPLRHCRPQLLCREWENGGPLEVFEQSCDMIDLGFYEAPALILEAERGGGGRTEQEDQRRQVQVRDDSGREHRWERRVACRPLEIQALAPDLVHSFHCDLARLLTLMGPLPHLWNEGPQHSPHWICM